ncbi:TPA: hypothetical protein U1D13_001916 [Streptococcus suis]|nr:hypothetical protein [Streptococcus suis]HEM3627256.1 hypothetical protein [Streptococcus suis]HEM3640336.1 hypothetical protein [Streptococcus suis]HEM3653381.1 hypothetical protein [Streptococcus suis]HEM3715844.1 hypothetical protein [Streptococcus suis]
MRKIHHYFKETLQKELVEKLIQLDFVECVEDALMYVRNKVRDEEQLVGYYYVVLQDATDSIYHEVTLSVYHTDWTISHFGVSWGHIPCHVNSLSDVTTLINVFGHLPFSFYFEKVTFDWKNELHELKQYPVSMSEEELVKYFKEKESELERRVGKHRYRVEFPEYTIRTFDECVWLLQELDQCFKKVDDILN